MKLRLAGLSLLAAALAIHIGVTQPAWTAAAAAQDAYRQARDSRRSLAQRVAAVEKRVAARQRLASVLASAALGPGDDVARLRRDAIAAARQAGVTGVRLEVSAGRSPAVAALRLAAGGPVRAVAALVADLPATRAVVLESVRLVPSDRGGIVSVELEGVRPGMGS